MGCSLLHLALFGNSLVKKRILKMSFLGISSTFLSFFGTLFASHAQRRLRLWWQNQKRFDNGPGVMGCEPPTLYLLYASPWNLIAALLIVGWSLILGKSNILFMIILDLAWVIIVG